MSNPDNSLARDVASSLPEAEAAALLHVLKVVDLELPDGEESKELRTHCEREHAELEGTVDNGLESMRVMLVNERTSQRGPLERIGVSARSPLPCSDDRGREARALTKQHGKSEKGDRMRAKWRDQYQRKVKRLMDLREQVKALEAEIHALERNSELHTTETDAQSDCDNTVDNKLRLENLLRTTVQTKMELQRQNTQLRKQLRGMSLAMVNLRQMLDAEHKLYLANSSYFVVLKPLTLPDCRRILDRAMEEIDDFVENTSSVPSCGTICSWDKRWSAGPRDFRFSLRKTLYGQSAEHVRDQTWRVFTNPMTWEKLFSPLVNMRTRFVQQVDDDNIVFFQDFAATDTDDELVVENHIVLISKFATEYGHIVMMRGLDRECLPVLDKLGPQTHGHSVEETVQIWGQYFGWVELRQEQGHCTMTYAGVKSTVSATLYYWVTEVVSIALRWERFVLGPKFSLP